MLLTLIINGAKAQSDEYYNQPQYRYSDKLVTGLEFTWEISKYNININSDAINTEDEDYQAPPNIKTGMTITVEIVQDLSNFTLDRYFDDDYTYEAYQKYFEGFFEVSYSEGDDEEMKNFFPTDFFISQNTIEYPNGTIINVYEAAYQQFQQNKEIFKEYGIDTTYEIINGLAIQKQRFNDSEDDFITNFETRHHIETGILIFIYIDQQDDEGEYELEFKLKSSKGIEINTIVPNDDPTLSIPFSATFVFALLLIPIISRKTRK